MSDLICVDGCVLSSSAGTVAINPATSVLSTSLKCNVLSVSKAVYLVIGYLETIGSSVTPGLINGNSTKAKNGGVAVVLANAISGTVSILSAGQTKAKAV